MMQSEKKTTRPPAVTGGTVARLIIGVAMSLGLGLLAAGPLEFKGGFILALIALFGVGGFITGFLSQCIFRTDASYVGGFIAGGMLIFPCVSGISAIMAP